MLLTVITISVAALPLLLTLIFRSSGALAFLTLCASNVMVFYVGEDTALAVKSLVHGDAQTETITKIVLLALPLLLVLILFRKTTLKRFLLLQVGCAALAGLATLVLIQQYLPEDTKKMVAESTIGNFVAPYHGFLFALGLLLSILTLWLSRPKHHDAHGHHKKGKH